MKSYVELSKNNWGLADDVKPLGEQLFLGCLQRIATATESMAENNNSLESSLRFYKNEVEILRQRNAHLRKVNAGLKRTITKMKNAKKD